MNLKEEEKEVLRIKHGEQADFKIKNLLEYQNHIEQSMLF